MKTNLFFDKYDDSTINYIYQIISANYLLCLKGIKKENCRINILYRNKFERQNDIFKYYVISELNKKGFDNSNLKFITNGDYSISIEFS